MRIGITKDVAMQISLQKWEMVLGWSYLDMGEYWSFYLYLFPVKINVYSGVIMALRYKLPKKS